MAVVVAKGTYWKTLRSFVRSTRPQPPVLARHGRIQHRPARGFSLVASIGAVRRLKRRQTFALSSKSGLKLIVKLELQLARLPSGVTFQSPTWRTCFGKIKSAHFTMRGSLDGTPPHPARTSHTLVSIRAECRAAACGNLSPSSIPASKFIHERNAPEDRRAKIPGKRRAIMAFVIEG